MKKPSESGNTKPQKNSIQNEKNFSNVFNWKVSCLLKTRIILYEIIVPYTILLLFFSFEMAKVKIQKKRKINKEVKKTIM